MSAEAKGTSAKSWCEILRDVTPRKPSLPLDENGIPRHPDHTERSSKLSFHPTCLENPKDRHLSVRDGVNLNLLKAAKAEELAQVTHLLGKGASLKVHA